MNQLSKINQDLVTSPISIQKADVNDPFHTTTLNELLKPIIANDRLKVLRRVNE